MKIIWNNGFQGLEPIIEENAGADIESSSAKIAIASYGDGNIIFTCVSEKAQNVFLSGNFNSWGDNENGKITNTKHQFQKVGENKFEKINFHMLKFWNNFLTSF